MKKLLYSILFLSLLSSCTSPGVVIKEEVSPSALNANQNVLSTPPVTSTGGEIAVSKKYVPEKGGTMVQNFAREALMEMIQVDMEYEKKNPVFIRNIGEGKQLVRIALRVTGKSQEYFPLYVANFSLDIPGERGIMESELGLSSEVQDHLQDHPELAFGKSVQGALYFEVPGHVKSSELVLSYESLNREKKSQEFKIRR